MNDNSTDAKYIIGTLRQSLVDKTVTFSEV